MTDVLTFQLNSSLIRNSPFLGTHHVYNVIDYRTCVRYNKFVSESGECNDKWIFKKG